MNIQEIYDLLDHGWVYVRTQDKDNRKYLDKVLLKRLKTKDIKETIHGLFIRKSDKLYKILKNMGMDISIYDSMVIISFLKGNREIQFKLYSLKEGENLYEIANKIINNNDF